MAAYYNEIDPFKAAWLRALIARGLIAPGEVDERSIIDVTAGDLVGFTQCHFFAGIGVWSYALRQSGWPDDSPVWTGSCPCQSFSTSGKREGFDDPRHLWPAWFRLLRECRPDVCFGEQVASQDGRAWLDVVSSDLEGAKYAVGASDLSAAGVGAPHKRQRLYWVAESHGDGVGQHARELSSDEGQYEVGSSIGDHAPGDRGAVSGMADAEGLERGLQLRQGRPQQSATQSERSGKTGGFWFDAEWIACTDGKARPIEPGSFPLVDGTPARLVRVRGYGDAIVAQVATTFIEAYLDVRNAPQDAGRVG